MNKFLVIIEKTESGFSSYSPDLDGCVATGRTKREVEKNMYEAIQFHLEGLKEEELGADVSEDEHLRNFGATNALMEFWNDDREDIYQDYLIPLNKAV